MDDDFVTLVDFYVDELKLRKSRLFGKPSSRVTETGCTQYDKTTSPTRSAIKPQGDGGGDTFVSMGGVGKIGGKKQKTPCTCPVL